MTRKVGNTIIIEPEPDKQCTECKSMAECRPYGRGGVEICFDCMMKTPESQEEAVKRCTIRMLGGDPKES